MVCPECGKQHRKYPIKCAANASFARGHDILRWAVSKAELPEDKRYDAWQVYAKTWGR